MHDSAILYAIMSLVFAGLHEIVFKRYSASERSRGMVICGIGVVWSLLLYVDVSLSGDGFSFTDNTWRYGLLAGLAVAVANILLLEAMRHMEVSLGSTIYRLNTIIVVILSVVYLGESLSLIKLIGISSGVVAVLLLYQHHHANGQGNALKLGLILVTSGAVLRAIYSVVTKDALSNGTDADSLMIISSLSWVVSGFCYAVFIENRYSITRVKLVYSIISGGLVYGVVKTLVTALSYGEASVVVSIANLSFLTALSVALFLKMERLSVRKLAAMGFAILAIILLTQS